MVKPQRTAVTETLENLLLAYVDLKNRLSEADETLRAIRCHEVDALVVADQVYTLQSAERPYRLLIEQMQEGALTVSPDGTIVYCNPRFGDMMGCTYDTAIVQPFTDFVPAADRGRVERILSDGASNYRQGSHRSARDRRPYCACDPHRGAAAVGGRGPRLYRRHRPDGAAAKGRDHRGGAARAVDPGKRGGSGGRVRSTRSHHALQPGGGDAGGRDVTSLMFDSAFPLVFDGNVAIGVSDIDTHLNFPVADALGGKTLTGIPAQLPRAGEPPVYVLVSAGPLHAAVDGKAAPTAQTTVLGCIITMTDITRQKKLEHDLAAASEKDHRIAESLQRSLLLKPMRNQFPGMEIEPFYKAAWDESQLGGDFFDTFALEHGRVALVVGDVSGKGLAAATRTAEIKFTLRAYLREHPDPARALERLNTFLCDSQELDARPFSGFVCITLVVVAPSTGDIAFVSAGMEEPLIVRAGGIAEVVNANGAILGVERAAYRNTLSRVRPGDLLLIMTDGVTEARRGRDLFGYDRLITLAKQASSAETLEGIVQVIVDGAQHFAGGKFQDDVCVLATRFL